MAPVLMIDPGHGGKDAGGGTNQYWQEKDLNLQISLYQYNRYKELGIPIGMTRMKDETLTPEERTRRVKASGAKYCHSNHINAGGGDGAEVIHSIYSDGKMAKMIGEELKKAGQNFRSAYTRTLPTNSQRDYYFMIRDTGKVETNIIEYGFADSSGDDIQQLRSNWRDFAEAVVKAFCQFAGYPYRSPSSTTQRIESVKKPENNTSGESATGNGSAGRLLILPADAETWRVYPLGVSPVKGNEKGFLKPSKFRGLEYTIEGSTQTHVYIIETANFGRVQIYAAPSTGAKIVNGKDRGSEKSGYAGLRAESKVNNLRFYSRPSWSDKYVVNTIDKGIGFPEIVDKVKVGKSYQYKVKNSKGDIYYLTANPAFVRIV
ncbi:N-acetylmuramoyl-L-alanine amidase family protein [Virgibacillus senegalensis]|uniref:N-acetylmuramoyl-L-alanine amidase family protein n=1 Tax=Virgibacillus senegalensis TaxID=1499679 RepID=UPI00069D1C1E|nr:N-acetylmuramoyl-L-alanine amidase [Virgibacillus senegalensis]